MRAPLYEMRAQDEGARWLVTLLLIPFAGGVGWLVKHLMGRGAEVIQLNLVGAQTEEIRARIRREDESAAVENLRYAAQELRADVERLRGERDAAEAREKMLELQLRREVNWRKANGWAAPPEGQG